MNAQKAAEGPNLRILSRSCFPSTTPRTSAKTWQTAVTDDYKEGDNKFTGTINKVTITVTPPPAQVEKEEDRGDAVAQYGIE